MHRPHAQKRTSLTQYREVISGHLRICLSKIDQWKIEHFKHSMPVLGEGGYAALTDTIEPAHWDGGFSSFDAPRNGGAQMLGRRPANPECPLIAENCPLVRSGRSARVGCGAAGANPRLRAFMGSEGMSHTSRRDEGENLHRKRDGQSGQTGQ
jgi:hypothetical protein